MKAASTKSRSPRAPRLSGAALITVLLVLTALVVVGTPFVISMSLHDRESANFSGRIAARQIAEAARNHALAKLEFTVYGREFAQEALVLEAERPEEFSGRRSTRRASMQRSFGERRGTVVRRDLGEEVRKEKEYRGRKADDDRNDNSEGIPEELRVSSKGPSSREHDNPDELRVELPETVDVLAAGGQPTMRRREPKERARQTTVGSSLRLHDAGELTGSVEVHDEQGKINLNTAPPNLLANLLGVDQLARQLNPQDTALDLVDAGMFYGDDDGESIDGAVVVVHPETGRAEAITYRRKKGKMLGDLFRGAFLSLLVADPFPEGSFVYDLRGWKLGFHRLWSKREGGFLSRDLARFQSIEAIREIADWQIASLFVTRFRGEGLTASFLRQNGVNTNRLQELGLDPFIYGGEAPENRTAARREYESVRQVLRRRGFSSALVKKLYDSRGLEVVKGLAARVENADRDTVRKLEKELSNSLSRDRRRAPKLPKGYLRAALEHLHEVYLTAGIETLLPEDMEALRDAVTVSSTITTEWSEAQSVENEVSMAEESWACRIPRAHDFNPGTVVRVRSLGRRGQETNEADLHEEFNVVGFSKQPGARGFQLAFPILSPLSAYGSIVQSQQRHPVNVNTASLRVLRALFTGVRGYDKRQIVTAHEADQLARNVMSSRPLSGHSAFHDLLRSAVGNAIDDDDLEPLLINAITPTHYLLKVSTTGLCYATGDVYELEVRGVERAPSGRDMAQAHFREIVDVSSPYRLPVGLLTQRDFAEGMFIRSPSVSPGFPEVHHHFLAPFAGTRGHLVQSRPLMLHRAARAFPGGDLGNLRLLPAETPDSNMRFTEGELLHYRNTFDGLELAHGESWPRSIGFQGSGRAKDLTTIPAGFELWLRLRTYPSVRSEDGHIVLFDAGVEMERNRISLLYDERRASVLLRIRDASVRDPSVVRNRDTGQYLEVAARRPLELHTWYHLRAFWDGVFGGGAQLYIDGVPSGTDNLSTELVSGIPASGQVSTIAVRDASAFPREGAVRIDSEVFEYVKSGNGLQIRREAPSHWRPLAISRTQQQRSGRRRSREIPPEPPDTPDGGRPGGGLPGGGRPGGGGGIQPQVVPPGQVPPGGTGPGGAGPGGAAGLGPLKPPRIMRSPWNSRGYSSSSHAAGSNVSLHGYSLEIRRKIYAGNVERQVGRSERTLVWGRGGRRLAGPDPLNVSSIPSGVSGLMHLDIDPLLLGTGEDNYVVPIFELDDEVQLSILGTLSSILPGAGGGRNAHEYFQAQGVCRVGGDYYLYRKEPLPQNFVAAQTQLKELVPDGIQEIQTTGLRIICSYPPSGDCLAEWREMRESSRPPTRPFPIVFGTEAMQYSLMADGTIANLYPPMGVLEVPGSPSPWEQAQGRPTYYGQPAFGKHPDDTVEWIRYREIFEENVEGTTFHLFVGRRSRSTNFRGYPERANDQQSQGWDLRNQLDHPPNSPLRLVMELSEGGAGHGDYVSIATRDPQKFEAGVRRVYKVLEHNDGRFFVSLLDVASNGNDIPNSPGIYQHSYSMADEPRLVKFPTWHLPAIGSGTGTFFGSFTSGGSVRGGRRNRGGLRERGEEDATGITVDEFRFFRNVTVSQPGPNETPAQFVAVPLTGGRVQTVQTPEGGVSLAGGITRAQSISRGSPVEVLIVALSRGNSNLVFGRGEKEGVLRIGEELFYFEAPDAAQGGVGGGSGSFISATSTSAQAVPGATAPGAPGPGGVTTTTATFQSRWERDPAARGQFWTIQANVSGNFEREGFARIRDSYRERSDFYEIFYYRQLGGGFQQCLRGQFGTALFGRNAQRGSQIVNVTRKLRLVGRSLLGSPRQAHGIGDAVALVPYLSISPITGPLTNTGLAVKDAGKFSRGGGYLLLDPAQPGVPWEIMAHLGPRGEGLLARPRDQHGDGILRSSFGTPLRPLSAQMFAYEMPYRYPDRYQAETESESLAYLQKSWRRPGALWRSLRWLERPFRHARRPRVDVVIVARFDQEADWDEEVTNAPGGLYLFEAKDLDRREMPQFELNRIADQLDVRVYFRYRSGAYTRIGDGLFTDDWKETPVLEYLEVKFEKMTTVKRHEELPY